MLCCKLLFFNTDKKGEGHRMFKIISLAKQRGLLTDQ